jgi:ATP-dependent protease Clp ATPase subunit
MKMKYRAKLHGNWKKHEEVEVDITDQDISDIASKAMERDMGKQFRALRAFLGTLDEDTFDEALEHVHEIADLIVKSNVEYYWAAYSKNVLCSCGAKPEIELLEPIED